MKETLALMHRSVVIALNRIVKFIAAQSSTPELRNSRICLCCQLTVGNPRFNPTVLNVVLEARSEGPMVCTCTTSAALLFAGLMRWVLVTVLFRSWRGHNLIHCQPSRRTREVVAKVAPQWSR